MTVDRAEFEKEGILLPDGRERRHWFFAAAQLPLGDAVDAVAEKALEYQAWTELCLRFYRSSQAEGTRIERS
jgi:hypothetical protein